MAKKPCDATPRTPPTDDETNARENLAAFFLILIEWDAREVEASSRSAPREAASTNSTSGNDEEKEAAHVDEDE